MNTLTLYSTMFFWMYFRPSQYTDFMPAAYIMV